MPVQELKNTCEHTALVAFVDYCRENNISFAVSGGGEVSKLLYNVVGGLYKEMQGVTFGSEKALEAAKQFWAETQEEESA